MSDDTLVRRGQITVDMVHNALNLVTYHCGPVVEKPEPACEWPKLCTTDFCRFPRYFREGKETGLVAHVLLELNYPEDLLRQLDREYEMSELIHPGVKIGRSRNAALTRIDRRGLALLSYLQDNQKVGWSWQHIAVQAFKPRWMVRRLDRRRRPWLY